MSELKELREINVFGMGSGNPQDVPERIWDLIRSCGALMGDPRLTGHLPPLEWQLRLPLPCGEELIPALEGAPKPLGVLVSGDTGFFSIARRIGASFPGRVRLFPGVSSLQIMASRIGESWANVPVVSLHGRPLEGAEGAIRQTIWDKDRCAVLFGEGGGVRDQLSQLSKLLKEGVRGWLGWDLGSSKEQLFSGSLEELANSPYTGRLCIGWFEAPRGGFFGEKEWDVRRRPLEDLELERKDRIPMTKFPVRCFVSSLLEPLFGSNVLEVGSGTGALTCHLGRLTGPGRIFSIERDLEALDLASRNAERLCPVGSVRFIHGEAPVRGVELEGPFQRVVVGGHGGNLKEIIRWSAGLLSPGGRIVIPCLLLSSFQQAMEELEALGFKTGFLRVFPGEGRRLGGEWMVQGGNPVDIVWGDVV
ncbi:precorrin-6Y C5,15-methyltransferase (decarboxylating), CbiT subunit [Thermanaerovibrio velox DSM 12556]|uniref:Precorrin-6Y C5,15-methyltransferase (Decarboxylating), CbiT subunit n=1 Tax=Thermanaerovibrio velox DSM 12556 TaxID=926567 RepID=H0UMW4_9BACT|nr:precorrin-6Y C5,15-methyltransferase (decarboxylating) subunit CbiT [Thermanaerovibrio velox]EHM09259.1 precorrin-6Y C5,15-methyltransferase (decarboxylating), CbiT subunit [Thermanaerovibrio velox DSM 12556]